MKTGRGLEWDIRRHARPNESHDIPRRRKFFARRTAGTDLCPQLSYTECCNEIDERSRSRRDFEIRCDRLWQRCHRVLDLRNRCGLYLEYIAHDPLRVLPIELVHRTNS